MPSDHPACTILSELCQALAAKSSSGKLSDSPLSSSIENFYMTDVVSRNSPTMAHCVKARKEMFTGI
jgi:hypothetical protein